jgi:hypothetical protein
MITPSKTFVWIVTAVTVFFAILLLTVAFPTPLYTHDEDDKPKKQKHVITWTPTSVSEVMLPGETKAISVQFVSSKNIRRASIEVASELEPFVSVEPSYLERIRKGQSHNLQVLFSVPDDATPLTLAGTIHLKKVPGDSEDDEDEETIQLRSSTRPSRVISKPLPVTLHIVPFPGTAEETLAYIGDLLSRGEIETALLFFSPSPINREVLENLNPEQRARFVMELSNARFLREVDRVRTYELDVTDVVDGTVHTTTLSMLRLADGHWIVMSW